MSVSTYTITRSSHAETMAGRKRKSSTNARAALSRRCGWNVDSASASVLARAIGAAVRPSQEDPAGARWGAELSTATSASAGRSRSGPTIPELPTKVRSPITDVPMCSQPKPARWDVTRAWSARNEPSFSVVRCGMVSAVEISTLRPTLAPSSRMNHGVMHEA